MAVCKLVTIDCSIFRSESSSGRMHVCAAHFNVYFYVRLYWGMGTTFEYVLFCLFKFQDSRNERRVRKNKNTHIHTTWQIMINSNIIDNSNQLFTIVNRFKSIHHCFAEAFQSHRWRSTIIALRVWVLFFPFSLSLSPSSPRWSFASFYLYMCVCVCVCVRESCRWAWFADISESYGNFDGNVKRRIWHFIAGNYRVIFSIGSFRCTPFGLYAKQGVCACLCICYRLFRLFDFNWFTLPQYTSLSNDKNIWEFHIETKLNRKKVRHIAKKWKEASTV